MESYWLTARLCYHPAVFFHQSSPHRVLTPRKENLEAVFTSVTSNFLFTFLLKKLLESEIAYLEIFLSRGECP
jgi:hypothetical protein